MGKRSGGRWSGCHRVRGLSAHFTQANKRSAAPRLTPCHASLPLSLARAGHRRVSPQSLSAAFTSRTSAADPSVPPVMALPTSVSVSSWVQDDATEETPLLSIPQRPATAIASLEEAAAALTSTTATLPLRLSPLSPHLLTDTGKAKDVVTCEMSPLSTPAVSKAALEDRKDTASDKSEPLLLHIAVTADAPQSSLCTVTDTHRSPHSSIVTSRVVSSNPRVNSLEACCKGSPGVAGSVSHSRNEAGGSSGKIVSGRTTFQDLSVDVIYAREPSEPAIDKMKAKRRLSRQTDVSSIELMTLNEGNELEDTQGKGSPFPATTHSDDHPSIATLQVQGENIHLSHCQLSPGGTRIQNLRTSSSTESCPRAPWNSLETNLSNSQDIEEKYIINEMRSHPAPQNLDPELDTDHEGGGSDQGERVSDDDPDRNAGGSRRRRSSAKIPEYRARGGWPESMLYQDWSAEAVVLVALLVYIACKVLSFMESLAPRRPGNRK
ncbi:hypothetical protein O3P69_001037 [Scylla paramamosain]|uniref:Uncharacterized protein n=1 Tax=Scylla paramamosain TaxID=85552 RepID=A0AAW0URI0_SCYPA